MLKTCISVELHASSASQAVGARSLSNVSKMSKVDHANVGYVFTDGLFGAVMADLGASSSSDSKSQEFHRFQLAILITPQKRKSVAIPFPQLASTSSGRHSLPPTSFH